MNIHVTNYDSRSTSEYDVIICALGYEKRSIFVPQMINELPIHKYALAFTDRHVLSYPTNKDWYIRNSFEIIEFNPDTISGYLSSIFALKSDNLKVVIDISSMSRSMLAHIIFSLKEARLPNCEATFLYAPAEYVHSHAESGPITVSEPVIPEFAGWSMYPEFLPAVIIGLGYEYDRALGVMEYLEPESVWAFIPRGVDERYDQANDAANKDLLEIIPKSNQIYYDVNNPYDCMVKLESLTFGLLKRNRPILVPFGPKIFSLLSLVVAMLHYPNTTVWRVSGGQDELPTDRIANGEVVGINVNITV